MPNWEQTSAVGVKEQRESSFNPWNYYKKKIYIWHLLLEDNINH
jgi:hypothetical protein